MVSKPQGAGAPEPKGISGAGKVPTQGQQQEQQEVSSASGAKTADAFIPKGLPSAVAAAFDEFFPALDKDARNTIIAKGVEQGRFTNKGGLKA